MFFDAILKFKSEKRFMVVISDQEVETACSIPMTGKCVNIRICDTCKVFTYILLLPVKSVYMVKIKVVSITSK